MVREGFSELMLLRRDLNEVRGEPREDAGEGYSMRQNGNNQGCKGGNKLGVFDKPQGLCDQKQRGQ